MGDGLTCGHTTGHTATANKFGFVPPKSTPDFLHEAEARAIDVDIELPR